jgi:hypothetical protein
MVKTNIRDIVTKPVSVEEPKVIEIHEKLGGKEFLGGSPAGSEAKPSPKREGFKMPTGGR